MRNHVLPRHFVRPEILFSDRNNNQELATHNDLFGFSLLDIDNYSGSLWSPID